MSAQPLLGVCYYPEHWPQERWAADAAAMHQLGLRVVRIGEFAWSRLEPEPGRYCWAWLDAAVQTLADAGLQIVLGTPTACPPKWLVDLYPDVLPHDEHGRPRAFGSRRHYCFSSATYRREAIRIVTAMAERYGAHPGVVGWQLDNEYGCHDTAPGLSPAARLAFRDWLQQRYQTIAALNEAWGTVFWSQEYRDFSEIDLPVATVTEATPAHRLDHWRFSSSQVSDFNRAQADTVRAHVPADVWVTHNFMGNFYAFDHFAVAHELDLATWDSYPLGFLDGGWFSAADKARYRQTGHPDWAAFHHDLYRGVGRGRFGVMEQQPGPVNWATWNAAPAAGLVRLWSWEAIAHGAELVSYFRWRQVPFGQEQMHAALQLSDGAPAPAHAEVATVAAELAGITLDATRAAPVALVFDYEALAMLRIQPHGADTEPLRVAFDYYSALRRLGQDVDVVPTDADLNGYQLIVVPCWPALTSAWAAQAADSGATLLLGARSGSRDPALRMPGELAQVLPLRVVAVDALRPGCEQPVVAGNAVLGAASAWLEHLDTELMPRATTAAGPGVWYAQQRTHYLTTRPDPALLDIVLTELLTAASLPLRRLPGGLRLRRRGALCFAVNYGPDTAQLEAAEFVLGQATLAAGEVAAWRVPAP